MEPVRDRRCGDAGVGKNRSQAGTAIGERSHLCGSGSAGRLEALTDLNCNVSVGSGDGAEDLPPTVGCLDVANANFQMPVTFLAATNECRVSGDGDARGGRYRLGHWDVTKLCAYLRSVWARNVSGLVPTSTGRRCVSTSAATRKGIRAERWARSRSNSGVDRQCDGQVTLRSM